MTLCSCTQITEDKFRLNEIIEELKKK